MVGRGSRYRATQLWSWGRAVPEVGVIRRRYCVRSPLLALELDHSFAHLHPPVRMQDRPLLGEVLAVLLHLYHVDTAGFCEVEQRDSDPVGELGLVVQRHRDLRSLPVVNDHVSLVGGEDPAPLPTAE